MIPGVRWWAYWGPDRRNAVDQDQLQFGVKVLSNPPAADRLRRVKGLVERGGDTFYFRITAAVAGAANLAQLENSRSTIEAALGARMHVDLQ